MMICRVTLASIGALSLFTIQAAGQSTEPATEQATEQFTEQVAEKSIEQSCRDLVSPLQETREQALAEIRKAGTEAIPALVANMETYWEDISPEIPYLLAELGAPAELAVLNSMDDSKDRRGLMMGLAVILISNPDLGEQTAQRLMSETSTGDYDSKLAWVLQVASGPVHEWLAEGLESRDGNLRFDCAKGVAWNLDPAGLPALERMIQSPDDDVVLQGIKNVGRRGLRGEPWRGVLIGLLEGERDVKASAAWALAHAGMAFDELLMKPQDPSIDSTLKNALEHMGDLGRDALVDLILGLPMEHGKLGDLMRMLSNLGAVNAEQSTGIAKLLLGGKGPVMHLAGGILQKSPELSAQAWELVLASTKAKGNDRRGNAAFLLGRADASNPAVKEALYLLLENPKVSRKVRQQAAMSLAQLGPLSERGVAPMIEALESDLGWAAATLAAAPPEFGPRVAPAIMRWIKRAMPLDGWARARAFSHLADVGLPAGPVVEAYLEDADHPLENRAALVRSVIAKTHVEPIVRLQALLESDPQDPLALHAAFGLAALGSTDALVVETLVAALPATDSSARVDPNSERLLLAIEGLGQMGEAAGSAIPKLLQLFEQESDFALLREIAGTLALLGPGDDRVIDAYMPSLSGGARGKRRAVLIGLREMGRSAQAAALETLSALKAGDSQVRVNAIDALIEIAGDSVELREALAVLLEDKELGSDALHILSEIGASPGECFYTLRQLFWGKATDEQMEQIAKAVAPLGANARSIVYFLIHQIRQNDSLRTRVAAIEAVGKLGAEGAPALPALIWSSRWNNWEKRRLRSRFGGSRSDAPFEDGSLITRWSDATWLDVRVASIHAIAAIGEHGKLAIPTLQFLTHASDHEIREAAREALEILNP